MDDPLRTILVAQIFEQTWQSNFRCCHGVGDRDVKLNVELVLLQVDDVPAFAEPTGSFFVRLKPKPEIQPKKGLYKNVKKKSTSIIGVRCPSAAFVNH